jgi:MFS family permease
MSQSSTGSFEALKIPNYRILFVGTLGSLTGLAIAGVLQGIVAFQLTGTNTAVGSVVFGQGLGMLTFGPIGGAYVDRLPKRRVVVVGQLISATIYGAFGILLVLGELTLVQMVLGSFILGAAFGMRGPARQALAIDLVPDGLRANAMALNTVANTVSRVVGPFVASVLLANEWAGPAAAYGVVAVLYGAAAALLLLLPKSVVRMNVGDTHVLQDLSQGVRYVWGHRHLGRYVVFFSIVMLVGFPHVTLIPGLLENEIGRPARDVTVYLLVSAIGGLIASVVAARFADSSRAPIYFGCAAVGFGASLVLFSQVPGYLTGGICMVAIGASNGAFYTFNGAVIAQEADANYMGRVVSLSLLAFAGFGITALPLGMLADQIGERWVLLGMGSSVVVISLWMAVIELRLDKSDKAH